jgi:hypothetical protein
MPLHTPTPIPTASITVSPNDGSATTISADKAGWFRVTADGGTNTWAARGGALVVNGGGGADTHKDDGRVTFDDFSAANGDALTIDKSLKESPTVVSDGDSGTPLWFASGVGVDLPGITTDVTGLIRWP